MKRPHNIRSISMNEMIVRCNGIGKQYLTSSESGEDSTLTVLDGIDFSLKRGTFTAIVGGSGCGKSTLLNIIGMLDRQTKGNLEIDGDILGAQARNRAEICRLRNEKIGFVFQNHNLLPEMTAIQNIMVPLLIRGESIKNSHYRAEDIMTELFSKEEMNSGVFDRTPAKMSGGQCQRVAIARALVGQPALVLADEPTGNLDEKSSKTVFNMLLSIQKSRALSIIMVTHNMEYARSVDHAVRLADGRLANL
jgi:lipoprotein-releasing system ATP-binding protein